MTDKPSLLNQIPWQLLRRAILPLVALALIVVAALAISRPPSDTREPRIAPPTPSEPQIEVVAALGVIEPSSQIIALGAEVSGTVVEVLVEPGELVAAGAPLLRIDPRSATASLAEQRAAVTTARANSSGRVQDVRASEAAVTRSLATASAAEASAAQAAASARLADQSRERARIALEDAQARAALFDAVRDGEAVSRDEVDRARFAVEQARVALAEASAGAEQADAAARVASAQAEAARASVSEARAVRDRTRAAITTDQAAIAQAEAAARSGLVDLERLIVRAPVAGTILRVDVRAGEFAAAGGAALIQMGETDPLHVRVEIDEEDAQRVSAGARAEGSLRSDATVKVPLQFVRFEPLATPKQNLAGGAARVDTRVVEAVYALDTTGTGLRLGRIFIGQQMDVFITATSPAAPRPSMRPAVPPRSATEPR